MCWCRPAERLADPAEWCAWSELVYLAGDGFGRRRAAARQRALLQVELQMLRAEYPCGTCPGASPYGGLDPCGSQPPTAGRHEHHKHLQPVWQGMPSPLFPANASRVVHLVLMQYTAQCIATRPPQCKQPLLAVQLATHVLTTLVVQTCLHTLSHALYMSRYVLCVCLARCH